MKDRIKLTKDTTLVTDSFTEKGKRILSCKLRPPKAEFYNKEEEAIRFVENTLYINRATLGKYGISLCIREFE